MFYPWSWDGDYKDSRDAIDMDDGWWMMTDDDDDDDDGDDG